MIKIAMSGSLGRMGQAIIALILNDPKKFQLRGCFESSSHESVGQKVFEALPHLNVGKTLKISSSTIENLKSIDVVIDFSSPKATIELVKKALKTKTALVIGTTGFTPSQLKTIRLASKKISIVLAPNMSVGANLLFALAEKTASVLSDDYDIEVVEAHHRHKKDAPSGTANRLAEGIARAKGWNLRKVAAYGRKGITGERPKKQIGMHVVRAGEIVGDHSAIYATAGECVELKHHASSRDAFAKGALVASKFIVKKKSGFYDMFDVLGFKRG